MGGCSAIYCKHTTAKGYRMHRFPTDKERRKLWLAICRRDDWTPGPNSLLCSNHFEESQYELKRADGRKLLKKSAVPTLFDVPNPPQNLNGNCIQGIGCPKPDSVLTSHLNASEKENNKLSTEALLMKIAMLEKENLALKNALQEKDKVLLSLFSKEPHISILQKSKVTNCLLRLCS